MFWLVLITRSCRPIYQVVSVTLSFFTYCITTLQIGLQLPLVLTKNRQLHLYYSIYWKQPLCTLDIHYTRGSHHYCVVPMSFAVVAVLGSLSLSARYWSLWNAHNCYYNSEANIMHIIQNLMPHILHINCFGGSAGISQLTNKLCYYKRHCWESSVICTSSILSKPLEILSNMENLSAKML